MRILSLPGISWASPTPSQDALLPGQPWGWIIVPVRISSINQTHPLKNIYNQLDYVKNTFKKQLHKNANMNIQWLLFPNPLGIKWLLMGWHAIKKNWVAIFFLLNKDNCIIWSIWNSCGLSGYRMSVTSGHRLVVVVRKCDWLYIYVSLEQREIILTCSYVSLSLFFPLPYRQALWGANYSLGTAMLCRNKLDRNGRTLDGMRDVSLQHHWQALWAQAMLN